MFPYPSKKGIALPWEMITVVAVLIVFLVLYLGFTTPAFGKSFSSFGKYLDSSQDHDKDGSLDLEDACPCTSGLENNRGCPQGYTPTGTRQGHEDQACLEKK